MSAINVVFDGPPSNKSGRFIEVENDKGASVDVGTWYQRGDGLWSLRVTAADIIRATEHPGSCENCGHDSDCGLHNEPALPIATHDCTAVVTA